MLIESDFFVGEYLRWNLGWASPNYAGAFVAALLALAFGFSGSRWKWGIFVLEVGGFFLLAKTYSRGALVAWAMAWLFGVLSTNGLFSKARCLWLGRVVALGVILYSVGFQWSRAGRALSEAASVDHSVGNRVELWQGGLKMIAAAPLHGWGSGESGRAYQHWFQSLEREERFTTMVNSYLTVAVEYGLPILAGFLFMLCVPVVCSWKFAQAGHYWGMAAGASLVSWVVENGFSTLWIEWRLWIVPCIAYFLLIGMLWRAKATQMKAVLVTGTLIWVTMVGFYSVGLFSLKNENLAIYPKEEGAVLASRNKALAEWHIWPDTAVLGEFYGKELRRWFTGKELSLHLVVRHYFGEKATTSPSSPQCIMLFGKQAARAGFYFPPSCELLYIICPTVSPPDESLERPERIIVVFPAIDEVGNRLAWERWAKAQGAKFIVSKGSGVDVRSVWPEVLDEVEEGGRKR